MVNKYKNVRIKNFSRINKAMCLMAMILLVISIAMSLYCIMSDNVPTIFISGGIILSTTTIASIFIIVAFIREMENSNTTDNN